MNKPQLLNDYLNQLACMEAFCKLNPLDQAGLRQLLETAIRDAWDLRKEQEKQ